MSVFGKAVFLSYASQDAEAAKRICESLRQAGIEVWFDQSELRGGDAWDQKIRRQIKECALFVPIISANTQARLEGYFRLEWLLAVERSRLMAEEKVFFVPVVIDGTTDTKASVPEKFREVQWTRLPVGHAHVAFCERVKTLLARADPAHRAAHIEALGRPDSAPARRRWLIRLSTFGAFAAIGVALAWWHPWRRAAARPTSALSTPTPAGTKASQLIAQAKAIYEQWDFATDRDLRLGDRLAKEATDLEPTNAEAWAVASLCSSALTTFGYDRTPARQDALRQQAEHAIRLDPKSRTARLALAFAFCRQGPTGMSESLRIFRELVAEAPADKFIMRNMGAMLRDAGQREESVKFLQQAVVLHDDPMAQYSRAVSLYWIDRLAEGDVALDRAISLRPDYVYAHQRKIWNLLFFYGKPLAALTALEQVPANFLLEDRSAAVAGQAYLWARDSTRCLAVLERASEYIGANYYDGPKRYLTGMAYRIAGRNDAAQLEWRTALVQIDSRLSTEPSNQWWRGWRARLLALLGERAAAEAELRLTEQQSSDEVGKPNRNTWEIYAALDRRVEVVDFFSSSVDASVRTLTNIVRLDPLLDGIRGEPRCQALLKRIATDPRFSPSGPPSLNFALGKSVAVLAFENLSGDKDNEYFSDGISEELLNVLAKVPGLRVAARTSAFYFKGRNATAQEIGQKLGVAHLVEGSVRRYGTKVRIAARLGRVETGEQIWSESYERELKDIFALQDEIARDIAAKLQLKLGASMAAKRDVNPEAYSLYLQGQAEYAKRGAGPLRRAAEKYAAALRLDPHDVPALVGLARAKMLLPPYANLSGPPALTLAAEAAQAAREALRLDPDNAAAHSALGFILMQHEWRWTEAEAEFRRALALAPEDAEVLNFAGDFYRFTLNRPLMLEFESRALALDPLSVANHWDMSAAWLTAGEFARAIETGRTAISMAPTLPDPYETTILAAAATGHTALLRETVAALKQTVRTNVGFRLFLETYAAIKLGDTVEARRVLAAMIPMVESSGVAPSAAGICFLHLGEPETAARWLTRAYEARDSFLVWPDLLDLEMLAAHPATRPLLERAGLKELRELRQKNRAEQKP